MPTKSGVTFWWLPEEESAFIQLLGGLGKPIAFHNRWFTERGQVAPQNLQEFIGVEEPSVLLFDYADEQMHSVRKDENFNARAKRILAWVRKKTPHWHQYKSYRVSARAKVQIDSGQQQVSLY
jgi:hypothetical protein